MYNSPLSDPRRKGRKRRRQAPLVAAAILVGAVLSFVLAFSLFWQLGDRVVGGEFDVGMPAIGFPSISIGLPSLPGFGGDEEAIAAVPARDYPVTPDLSLGHFRDQAYRPVKGIYLSSWAAGHNGIFTDQLALVDRTELNAMVIDVKDATGYVTYDANVVGDVAGGVLDVDHHGVELRAVHQSELVRKNAVMPRRPTGEVDPLDRPVSLIAEMPQAEVRSHRIVTCRNGRDRFFISTKTGEGRQPYRDRGEADGGQPDVELSPDHTVAQLPEK